MADRQCYICGFELHIGTLRTGIYLFRTPLIQTGIVDTLFVCSIHFDESCFKVIVNPVPVLYLKRGSVPTKYLHCNSPFSNRKKTMKSSRIPDQEYKIVPFDLPKLLKYKCCEDKDGKGNKPENLTSRLCELSYNVKTCTWSSIVKNDEEFPATFDKISNARDPPRMSGRIRSYPDRYSTPELKSKKRPYPKEQTKQDIQTNFTNIKRKRADHRANDTESVSVPQSQTVTDNSYEVDEIDGFTFTSFVSAEQLNDFVLKEESSLKLNKLTADSLRSIEQQEPSICPPTIIPKENARCMNNRRQSKRVTSPTLPTIGRKFRQFRGRSTTSRRELLKITGKGKVSTKH